MSGGGSSPVTTTTNTGGSSVAPWAPSQPYLMDLMNTASANYGNAVNMGAWGGDPQAGNSMVAGWQDPYTAPSLAEYASSLWQTANDPSVMAPVINAQNLANQQMQDYGMTPDLRATIGGLGQVGQQYQDIYQKSQDTNPFEQSVLDQIGNQVQSSMSGAGRYGSGAYDKAIAAGISPTMMQEYELAQNRGLQATGGLGNVYNTEANIYNQGLNRAGMFAQLSPTLAQARFIPSNALGQVADLYSNLENARLGAAQQYWNQQQALPMNYLGQAANVIIPGAGLGRQTTSYGTGTSTTTVPQGQRILGGALAGAGLGSAFGPIGTGIGALGGGLAGGFL